MKFISVLLLILAFAGCAEAPSRAEASRSRTPEYDSEIVVNADKLPLYRNVRAERSVPPVYSPRDLDAGAANEVLVGAVVEKDGKVSATFMMRALASPDLQKAAQAAMMQWRFPPILKDGEKIRYAVAVPMQFSVQN
jgi:TonB family protein